MLNLNREQLIDLAEAMSRYGGHGFSYIQNIHPSIKSTNGKWYPVSELHWKEIEHHLNMKVVRLPSKITALGAVSKIKNVVKMQSVIEAALSTVSVNDIMNDKVHKRLSDAILLSGATYQSYSPLNDVMQSLIKRVGRNPQVLSESLMDLSSIELFWPENENKLNVEMKFSDVDEVNGVWVLKDPAPLMLSARFAFEETPSNPLAFSHKFHQMCASSSVSVATSIQSSKIEVLPPDVKQVLIAAHQLGISGDEPGMKHALMQLKYMFSPRIKPRFASDPKAHLDKIRQMLNSSQKETKKAEAPARDDSQFMKNVESVLYQDRAQKLMQNIESAISLVSANKLDMSTEWERIFPVSLLEMSGDELLKAIRYAEIKFEPDFKRAVSLYSSSFIDRVIGLNTVDGVRKDRLSQVWRKFDVALHSNDDYPEKQFLFCAELDSVLSIKRIGLVANEDGLKTLSSIEDELASAIKTQLTIVKKVPTTSPIINNDHPEYEDKREFTPISKVRA